MPVLDSRVTAINASEFAAIKAYYALVYWLIRENTHAQIEDEEMDRNLSLTLTAYACQAMTKLQEAEDNTVVYLSEIETVALRVALSTANVPEDAIPPALRLTM